MTGINLNVQNSYAALYNTSQSQTVQSTTTSATSDTTTIRRGEQLTLSAEAIALSQQSFQPTNPTGETTLGSGTGIRPPSTLGSGTGIRPPTDILPAGDPDVKPPSTLGSGTGIRPPGATVVESDTATSPSLTS